MTTASAIQPHDLTRPAPLRSETRRRLAAHEEAWIDAIKASIRSCARLSARVQVRSIETVRGDEISEGSSIAWWHHAVVADDRVDGLLLGLDSTLVFQVIDRTLGGPGLDETPQRAATALETDLGNRFVGTMLDELMASFHRPPLRIPFEAKGPLGEPVRTWLPDRATDFVAVYLDVEAADRPTQVAFLFRRDLVEPAGAASSPAMAAPTEPVAAVPTLVTAEIGRCRLTVDELRSLEPGDVLLFGKAVGASIDLRIDGRSRMSGTMGQSSGRIAVRIDVMDDGAAS